MTLTVLVADDDRGVRFTVRETLEEQGLVIEEAADGRTALTLLETGRFDVVVSDYQMPGLTGLELLGALQQLPEPPPLILLTAHGSERLAVEAMRSGAEDYLAKPFDPAELVLVVQRALEKGALSRENQRLKAELALARSMVFRSDPMKRVALMVERVARRDTTILIRGETGTGKELVAAAIVEASPRADQPYVRFNCAALPGELADAELFGHTRGAYTGAQAARVGLIRQADGGTLLLDEVGELALPLQAKLLRVLQEGEVRPVGSDKAIPVDVRVLAATHRDLKADVESGRFREDLLYRLNVVPIEIPPLRERREDIPLLVGHFVRSLAARFRMEMPRVTPQLLDRLSSQPWPGNVRELEHEIERRMTLLSGVVLDVDPLATSSGPQATPGFKSRVEAFERRLLSDALEAAGHNHSQAARQLGMSRTTFLAKLQKFRLTQ